MDKINTGTASLRKFALTFTAFLCVVGTIVLLRHKAGYVWYYKAGLLFAVVGLLVPGVLKPVYTVWMKLTFILGWVNTRVILVAIFYLLFTPVGLIMRIFGTDLLDRKIIKTRQSYWKNKVQRSSSPADYERQF
jgi:hypothetical protein